MSEVSLFQSGDVALPDYLKQTDEDTKKLAGEGRTFRRISIEGGVWRMVVGGKEVGKNTERHLDVVIARASDANSRTFYEGTYQKGVKTAPSCLSHDGIRPDPKSTKPQSTLCANCPQNVAGSGQGDSRACRFSRRVAVLLANDIPGELYSLSIPAASLFGNDVNKMGLQQYARKLQAHGVGMNAVVTRLHFDLDASTPKLVFEAIRPLQAEEFAIVTQKRNSEEAKLAVNTPVHEQDGVAAAPADTSNRVQGNIPTPPQPPAQGDPTVRGGPAAEPVKVQDALAAWANTDD